MSEYLIGGLAGLFLGLARYSNYDQFIEAIKRRNQIVTYYKIVKPILYFEYVSEGEKLYSEGIQSYLCGFPNASLVMIFRCLETGLKNKYKEAEKKEPKLTSEELINWAETYLGRKKELAHGFRLLRNLVHEEKTIEEQDALESIRHISNILNILFPFENVTWNTGCIYCKTINAIQITKDEAFYGNNFQINCRQCHKNYNAVY